MAISIWSRIGHTRWRCGNTTAVDDEVTDLITALLSPAAGALRWVYPEPRQALMEAVLTASLEALLSDLIMRQCVMDTQGVARLESNIKAIKVWVASSDEVPLEDKQILLQSQVFKKFECIHRALAAPPSTPLPEEAEPYSTMIEQLQRLKSFGANCYLPFFCTNQGTPPSPDARMRREFGGPDQ